MDDFENFDVVSVIGSGSFGTCYKVKHKLSLQVFVWKAINYGQMSEEKKQSVVSEVNVLSKLRHPNIIRYYDHINHKKSSTLYIIMEYCSGGDISKVIRHCAETSQCLNEIFIWRILYQIASALAVCHSQYTATVLHRDIKPANVFLDAEYNVKLGDFGLAKILEAKENYTDTFVGTPLYMSPEQIKNKKYDKKSDIWALGCLIYETCSLKPPFTGHDIENLSNKIKEGIFHRIPTCYSDDLHKMVLFMLSTDSECRPTINVILRHPTVVLKSCKAMASIYQSSPTDHLSKATENKVNINLQNKFIQTKKVTDKFQNLESKFTENLQFRLENIRNREAAIKQREEKLNEKERILNKRERKIALMERLANEKVARANLYLKRSKDNKAQTDTFKRKQSIEAIDSSFSADPGDTSIVPTSTKFDEEQILKPKGFVRSKSERKVHFNAQKVFQGNPDQIILREYNFFQDKSTGVNDVKKSKLKNYFKPTVSKSINNKITQSNSSIESSSLNNSDNSKITRPISWSEENKRCAFSLLKLMNAECEKENICSKIAHTKM